MFINLLTLNIWLCIIILKGVLNVKRIKNLCAILIILTVFICLVSCKAEKTEEYAEYEIAGEADLTELTESDVLCKHLPLYIPEEYKFRSGKICYETDAKEKTRYLEVEFVNEHSDKQKYIKLKLFSPKAYMQRGEEENYEYILFADTIEKVTVHNIESYCRALNYVNKEMPDIYYVEFIYAFEKAAIGFESNGLTAETVVEIIGSIPK